MTVSLTLTVQKSYVNGVPTVSAATTLPTGIPATVFVYASDTGLYDRVASTTDLRLWGTATTPYQLAAGVTRTCASVAEAEEFASFVQSSIARLVNDWALETPFASTVSQTFTA